MEETIYSRFQRMANKYSRETAIIENNRSISYEELLNAVDIIAARFDKNIKSVGVIMEHSAEMIATVLSVLKIGAMYVPAECDFPVDRIKYMMKESEVDLAVINSGLSIDLDCKKLFVDYSIDEILRNKPPSLSHIKELRINDTEDRSLNEDKDINLDKSTGESLAYVLYTSGTTGYPKGVCINNKNVCHYARAFNKEFHNGPKDIMLQYSVCTFDIFVEEVFGALLNGAAIAIPSKEDALDINRLMDFVEKHNVTMISGFPYLLAKLNELPKIPKSIRVLISGGDVLRHAYVDKLLDKAMVYNTYGPSETTVCATYYNCSKGYVLDDGTYPIGLPVLGVDVKIIDEKKNELPPGEKGEICILGDGVGMGYTRGHEKEEEAFSEYDDRRMYKSGDLGYVLPDNNIAFLCRMDNQVMIYGKRVELSEVEICIKQCDGVKDAKVAALKNKENLPYLIANVIKNKDISPERIRAQLSKKLPEYMIPKEIIIDNS